MTDPLSSAPTEPPTVRDEPPKRRRKRWPWVVGTLLVLLATPLVIWWGWTMSLRSEIRDRLDAIRAAGEPVTLEELDAWYVVPEGENAAEYYIAAFDLMVEDGALEAKLPEMGASPTGEYVEWPAWDQPLPAQMQDAMRQYLDKNADALQALHEASDIKESRYPIDMTQGIMTLLPDVGPLREAARLLRLQAALAADEGRPEDATRSVSAMLRLARSLDEEPILISALVRMSVDMMAVETTERVIARADVSAEQLSSLEAHVRDAMGHRTFRRAIAGERAMAMSVFQDGSINLAAMGGPNAGFPSVPGFTDRDHLAYLRLSALGVTVLDDPTNPPDMDAALEELPRYCLITRIVLPATDASAMSELRHEAMMRATLVGLAVKRYQLTNDDWPPSLDALKPTYLDHIPIDPFDGKPLRYVVEDDIANVYSIGKDGVDDEGVVYDAAGERRTDGTDAVFRVK